MVAALLSNTFCLLVTRYVKAYFRDMKENNAYIFCQYLKKNNFDLRKH